MAGYTLQSSYDTVQVFSPTEAVDSIFCTIVTDGSGSVVQRTIPKDSFGTGRDVGLLESLATAVDDAISGGLATGAVGTQDVDDQGLIMDAVTFTVTYTPSQPTIGPLTTTVTIPVNVLTADTQFGSFLGGGSATDRLGAAYDNLRTLAGG